MNALIDKLASEPTVLSYEDLLNLLHRLIERNFPKVTLSFIEQLPILTDLDKTAALHKTIWHKQQEAALCLIKSMPASHLNWKNPQGQTAFDLAVSAQLHEVLHELQNRLPQEILCTENAKATVKLYQLIEKGDLETDLTAADISEDAGYLALCFAIQKKRTRFTLRLIELLPAERFGSQGQDIDGLTPLHWAIHLEFEVAALALIEKLSAEQLSTPTKRGGQTSLFWAINSENLERVSLTLIQKLPVELLCKPENGGPTALFWALRNSKERPSQAFLLIEKLSPEQLHKQNPLNNLRFEEIDPEVAAALSEKMSKKL